MNALLVSTGVALLATIPVAGLAWAAASGVERLTRDPQLRERSWNLAFALPSLAAVLTVLVGLTPEPATPAISAAAGLPQSVVIVIRAAAAPAEGASALPHWAAVLAATSIAGALFRLARSFMGARRLRRQVRRARLLASPELTAGVAGRAAALGKAAPSLLVSDDVDQPLLAGLRRPAVLLPRAFVESRGADELLLVCAHELAHAARRDNLRLVIEGAVEGALWFNPFVAAMRAGRSAAREEVCDALALAQAAPPDRRRYAETLVQALRLSAGPEPQTAFTGRRRNTAMRLQAILEPAAPAALAARVSAAALLGVAVAGAATGAAALAAVSGEPAPRASQLRRWGPLPPPPPAAPAAPLPPLAVAPPAPAAPPPPPVDVRPAPPAPPPPLAPQAPAPPDPGPRRTSTQAPLAEAEGAEKAAVASSPPAEARRRFAPAPLKPGVLELAADEFRQTSPATYVYEGRPTIRGIVEAGPPTVSINGEAAPAGLDLSTITPERIEVSVLTADGQPVRANTPKDAPKRTLVNIMVEAQ